MRNAHQFPELTEGSQSTNNLSKISLPWSSDAEVSTQEWKFAQKRPLTLSQEMYNWPRVKKQATEWRPRWCIHPSALSCLIRQSYTNLEKGNSAMRFAASRSTNKKNECDEDVQSKEIPFYLPWKLVIFPKQQVLQSSTSLPCHPVVRLLHLHRTWFVNPRSYNEKRCCLEFDWSWVLENWRGRTGRGRIVR